MISRVCLITVFEIVLCFKKIRRIKKSTKKHIWFLFFFVLKNTKNIKIIKFLEKEPFSNNTKNDVLYIFKYRNQITAPFAIVM